MTALGRPTAAQGCRRYLIKQPDRVFQDHPPSSASRRRPALPIPLGHAEPFHISQTQRLRCIAVDWHAGRTAARQGRTRFPARRGAAIRRSLGPGSRPHFSTKTSPHVERERNLTHEWFNCATDKPWTCPRSPRYRFRRKPYAQAQSRNIKDALAVCEL